MVDIETELHLEERQIWKRQKTKENVTGQISRSGCDQLWNLNF